MFLESPEVERHLRRVMRHRQDHGTRGNSFTEMTDTEELNHYTQERLELELKIELNHLREKYRDTYPEEDELLSPDWEREHDEWLDRYDIRREEDYCWEYLYESILIEDDFETGYLVEGERDDDEYDLAPVWEQEFWDAIQDGTVEEYLEAYDK